MKPSPVTAPPPSRIAVLMTCHDRRPLTLRCLESLEAAERQARYRIGCDVFLVDDGSVDGTGAAVRGRFPSVRVITGSGSLFWCGGMRLAWAAAAEGDYDGYLWLNDDVVLNGDSLDVLVATMEACASVHGATGIAVGSTVSEGGLGSGVTTYGAVGADGVDPPGDAPRRIELFNGNIVLVSREAFRVLGTLSAAYTHGLADIDYGIRARKHGVKVFLAAGHQGVCTANATARWLRPDLPVWKRLYELHKPTGCPPWQLARLVRSNGGWYWPWSVAKLYLRALFPTWF